MLIIMRLEKVEKFSLDMYKQSRQNKHTEKTAMVTETKVLQLYKVLLP